MAGLALTDRDGLYGAFKHAHACVAAGIAPILGANLAVNPGRGKNTRVTVLAQGKHGWAALCRLLSAGASPLSAQSKANRNGKVEFRLRHAPRESGQRLRAYDHVHHFLVKIGVT